MRADHAYTYLQCGFDPDKVRDQMHQLRARFGNEILFHMEFMKNGTGQIIPGAIPLVYFTTEERLNEMIAFCREIGVFVANPVLPAPLVNDAFRKGGPTFPGDIFPLMRRLRKGKTIVFSMCCTTISRRRILV